MNEDRMSEPAKILIKAQPGRRVKDPLSLQLLAADGELKPDNVFWRRRLNDGDVVEIKAAPKAKSKPTITDPAAQAKE